MRGCLENEKAIRVCFLLSSLLVISRLFEWEGHFFKMLCNVRMEQHRNSSPTNQIHYSDNGPQHLLDLAIASLKILTECSTVSFRTRSYMRTLR